MWGVTEYLKKEKTLRALNELLRQALVLSQDGLSVVCACANVANWVAKLIVVDGLVVLDERCLNDDAVVIVCWCEAAVLVRWNRD